MNKPAGTDPDRERLAHLAAIVDSSDDAILSKDLDGIITSWNTGAERLYGYTAEEVIGRPVSVLMPEDRPDEFPGIMARLLRGERVEHYETVRVTKDGRRVNVSLTISPVRNDQKRIVGFSAVARDITERLRAEQALRESSERLRLAQDAAGIGIHDYNPSTGTIGWDSRTRSIWGYGEEEPVTYDLWIAGVHPEDRESAEAALVRALDPAGEGVYLAEYRVVNRRDRRTRWVHVTGHATFSGGTPVRLVGTVQDITDRKRTEEALAEASRRKDEFLATLSHELRTPLAAIHGAAKVLDNAGDVSGRAAEMVAIVDRQASQLVRLIDDLLDVTRITRGRMRIEREPIDVVAIVQTVADDFHVVCGKEEIDLSISVPRTPIVAHADPVRLEQVVNNLLSNACRFTPRGGGIQVAVEPRDDDVEVRVADTGIGMTREELDQIFEMFAQVQSPDGPRTEGLGIGLSLARSIIELHGGTLEANSAGPGQGSEFRVRLPAVDTETPERTSVESEAPAPEDSTQEGPGREGPSGAADSQLGSDRPSAEHTKGRRIVAAEDNADALYALTLILRMHGHEIITAVNGTEALAKVQENRPEVALLDIDMPGMDGYEVARKVRGEPWGRDMLLIAMTGWGQEQDKQRALDAGFDMHMTKPVDPEALQEILRSAV